MPLVEFFRERLARLYGVLEAQITEEFLALRASQRTGALKHQVSTHGAECISLSFLKHLDAKDLERLCIENEKFALSLE